MPVVGMVLKVEEGAMEMLRLCLSEDPHFTMGRSMGGMLPVVMESDSQQQEQDLLFWLWKLPGLLAADPVWADFSDLNLKVAS